MRSAPPAAERRRAAASARAAATVARIAADQAAREAAEAAADEKADGDETATNDGSSDNVGASRRRRSSKVPAPSSMVCVVCLDEAKTCILLPCRVRGAFSPRGAKSLPKRRDSRAPASQHLCCCRGCTDDMVAAEAAAAVRPKCPICRAPMASFFEAYL